MNGQNINDDGSERKWLNQSKKVGTEVINICHYIVMKTVSHLGLHGRRFDVTLHIDRQLTPRFDFNHGKHYCFK